MTPAEVGRRDLKSQIEALTERVKIGRHLAPLIIAGWALRNKQMTDKLSNLGAVASEIDKLTSAIEADAKKRIERIAGVHAKKDRVFAKADAKIATRDAAIDATDVALDKLDAALGDNGGDPLPTSDDSSKSS